MLKVTDLHAGYGAIKALKGVSLSVEAGEFVAILGPNGAGKSTLMKAVLGVLKFSTGSIRFKGEELASTTTVERIRRGLGVIPEGRQLFAEMSVRENLVLGAYAQLGVTIPSSIEEKMAEVFDLFPRLRERRQQAAGTLSGGEAQMLAIARALMASPTMLICDEPSVGLSPKFVRDLLAILQSLRGRGITIVLADQNAIASLRVADRGYILDTGKVVATGYSKALMEDPALRAAYLGIQGTL
ncbi:ABC transporter ATP-binding protein [Roseiarcaceae bacterium H3SJ34-1]|uniref:ABC transporter ATP-binding protein n=1 Tax=Terripilifer ovatus TaxID=3032367 RepID=UPI003AB947FE|nr:ABC transporter ATP-binding protein [Roseiarcaceae bacterium H3SJ34-1]